jgi:hypothetical protein
MLTRMGNRSPGAEDPRPFASIPGALRHWAAVFPDQRFVLDSLPRTASGKPDRRAATRLAAPRNQETQ